MKTRVIDSRVLLRGYVQYIKKEVAGRKEKSRISPLISKDVTGPLVEW